MSEDDGIHRFEPRANPGHDSVEALVWAIDDAHAPAYWFPRDCPRGTFWASAATTDDDVTRFLLGDLSLRVHALQGDWLDAVRAARLVAYRLPPATFERYERANGYWVSREAVTPVEVIEIDDVLGRHAAAGIELRIVRDLWSVWQQVIGSTLEFSGIRLRNLQR